MSSPEICRRQTEGLQGATSLPMGSGRASRRWRLLHELGTARAHRLVVVHDAEAPRHFAVRLHKPAHVATETILVEFVRRLDVPQAAGVGRYLVGDDDAHHVAFPQTAAFHL